MIRVYGKRFVVVRSERFCGMRVGCGCENFFYISIVAQKGV
jgi:hypothetical protein